MFHVWVVLVMIQVTLVSAGKILMINNFFGGSHVITLRKLAEALTENNHEVKILRWLDTNNYPPVTNPKISDVVMSINNTDGLVSFVTNDGNGRFEIPGKLLYENGLTLKLFPLEGFSTVSAYCRELVGNQRLYEQLKYEKYDVVIVDLMFNECSLGLAHKLGVPAVGFWGFSFMTGPAHYTPMFNPPSGMPQTFSGMRDMMSFMDRVWNTLFFLGIHLLMEAHLFVTNKLIHTHYPDSPHPSQLLANMSGMLMNSHPAIDYPRLLPPSFMEVGGLHLSQRKPLPEDILDFLNRSKEDGVILFSLGYNFDPAYVPRKVYDDYFKAFSKLKQKVIVKANAMPTYLPANVKIFSFVPQADILAHNSTVLFVSHCGFHGVFESVYHAVPIVGIPVFLDQKDNLVRLIQLGVSEGLEKESDPEEIYNVINSVIEDPRYKKNMESLSKRVKSFENPMGKAVWLLEHIMKTKGASHLKMSSRNLGLFQYLCFDVFLFLAVLTLGFIYVIFSIISKIRRAFKDQNLTSKVKMS